MKMNVMTNRLSKFASLSAVMFFTFFTALSVQAAGQGDLDVYTPPAGNGAPTLMFMLETSTYMNDYDAVKWLYGNEQRTDASGKVTYKRYYTYNLGESRHYSRITRLKDTIFYLMDAKNADGTPVIPADYKIGLGNYTAAGGKVNDFEGQRSQSLDPVGSAIVIPALPLGDINSEQRMRIKRYVAALCNNTNDCTGAAPMAWAYAEAGAYLMGTKTAPIILSSNGFGETAVLSRKLRGKNPSGFSATKWQYCPDDKQKMMVWIASSYRLDCAEGDWVDVNKDNAADYGLEWNCGLLNCTSLTNRPHGIVGKHTNGQQFLQDGITNPNNGWTYFYDETNKPTNMQTLSLNIVDKYYGTGIRNGSMYLRQGTTLNYATPLDECSATLPTSGGSGSSPSEQPSKSGIIFFTAGYPSSGITYSSDSVMNMSLTPADQNTPNPVGGNLNCDSGFHTPALPAFNNWGCIGGYAKRLNSTQNPLNFELKTGVFMFAKANERLTSNGTNQGVPTYDCNGSNSPKSILNACKLASENYGGGGYIQSTQTTTETANAQLATMLSNYASTATPDLGTLPTGLPAVVKNPYYANALQKDGFLPLINPDLTGTKALLEGNLRKYRFAANGFVDKQGNSPFTTSFDEILSETTLDFWSAKTQAYTSRTQAGGVYEKLPGFNAADASERQVYIESDSSSNMTKLQATATAMTAVTVNGITGEQDDLRRRLLNFMGYKLTQFVSGSTDPANPNTTDAQIVDTKSKQSRVFGGVFHSTPAYIGYEASIETDGSAKPTKGSIIVGSMNNALHIVDATTGVEQMAFIPQEVLQGEGYKALNSESTMTNPPNFGVDGSWIVDSKYSYDFENSLIKANKVHVYGGLRLGGKQYYGLDVTSLTSPKLLFSVHAGVTKDGKKPFQRIGYTWAKPVITKINWGGLPKKVMIVPAGYDATYDLTDDKRVGLKSTETQGNAVYVISAEGDDAGDALFVLGKSTAQGATAVNANMNFSIVSSIKVLDRNADGLTDHLYFADLGGQVFRADINNTGSNASVTRVHRIANLKDAHGTNTPAPRFYETPVVTIHSEGNQRFAAVSVASGDRSSPSFKNSDSTTGFNGYTNQVYVIFDKDVARRDLYQSGITLHTTDITKDKLTNTLTSANAQNMLLTLGENRLDGWYQPLNRFGSNTKAKHLKALGPLSAVSNDLYVSVFDYFDGADSACSSQVRGKTEANRFCLPYGVCGTEVNRQRFAIGRGISPVTYGSTGDNGQNRKILTQVDSATQPNPTPLEPKGPTLVNDYGFNYKLSAARWFEMLPLSPLQDDATGTTQ